MKIIEARYDDICHTCTGKIKPGDLIWWEKKNSHHARCKDSVVGKWAGGQR